MSAETLAKGGKGKEEHDKRRELDRNKNKTWKGRERWLTLASTDWRG